MGLDFEWGKIVVTLWNWGIAWLLVKREGNK